MSTTLKYGGHVSSAGGIANAVERVRAIGGNTVQIFSASPRIWKRLPMAQSSIDAYLSAMKKYDVQTSVIHAIYLVNLASENPELVEKSRSVIAYDLEIDSKIKGEGVVVHVGSHQGRGFEAVKDQLVREITTILENSPEDSTFLIENSAGQQGKIASNLEEIRFLLDNVKSKRLGWCLDTCHAWAAGYVLKKDTMQGTWIADAIDKSDLWDTLRVVHVNDSRDPYASGRDRHDNLGDGSIGNDQFESFFQIEQIRSKPLILEVPGMDGTGPDAENINRLVGLLG